MSRMEQLQAFMRQYDNKSFNMPNVTPIMMNLRKAEQDNRLRDFLMNVKPYQSAFPFLVYNKEAQAVRGKDQVALVFALNLYGRQMPGFALRLNRLLKELIRGSSKEAQAVVVLMRAQMELQSLEISLINFVDRELMELVNRWVKAKKGVMVVFKIACLVGGAIGMPGFTMAGLIPLTFVAIAAFISGFFGIAYWLGLKPFTEEEMARAQRFVGEC